MRKIVAVRSKGAPARRRYLSKSNGNIARLATIAGMFPDAIIVSPYRRPLDHARSLLRQHQNFLAMHEQDRFTREYMGGIGHYDFGANLKPINFAGWLAQAPPPDFASLNGWIRYWCAAYGFLLDQPNVPIHFLSYDALCTDPEPELERLEAVLGVRNPGALLKQAGDVRQPTRNHPIADGVDAGLLRQAEEVFECLEGRPLGRPAREVDPERPSLLGASHPSKNPTGSALGRG